MAKKRAKSPAALKVTKRLSTGVKTLRARAEITLAELVYLTGMSRNALWLIENKNSNARLSTIDTLAECFQVNPMQLLVSNPIYGRLEHRSPLPQLVAENIARYRADAHLTQEALGRAVGLAKNYASLIEGSAPDLKLGTVGCIAGVLGIDVILLLADPREI
jgi:transcriptional regulator with XRE-family HTH domain